MAKISDIQPTPNPNSMRFVLKENLTNGESYSYDFGEHENEQINDIFKYDGVDNIFVMKNFVTITQDVFNRNSRMADPLIIWVP